jgi:hypothetical protein
LEFVHTFEDIVRGERTVHRVGEDEHHIAFLDPTPVRPGHVIAFPKAVSDQLFEMPPDAYGALMEFARAVAVHMKACLPCERVCMTVIGWQVRHAHYQFQSGCRERPTTVSGSPVLPELTTGVCGVANGSARRRTPVPRIVMAAECVKGSTV